MRTRHQGFTLLELLGVILIAGRYEGVDQRLIAGCVDEECSIGDYVLSGGETAAMEAVALLVTELASISACERT